MTTTTPEASRLTIPLIQQMLRRHPKFTLHPGYFRYTTDFRICPLGLWCVDQGLDPWSVTAEAISTAMQHFGADYFDAFWANFDLEPRVRVDTTRQGFNQKRFNQGAEDGRAARNLLKTA